MSSSVSATVRCTRSGLSDLAGLLDPALSVADALSQTNQGADYARTAHLHAPILRLVYLPYALRITCVSVPEIPEGHELGHLVFVSARQTAAEVVDAIVDEFGIRRTIQLGVKQATVEYALSLADGTVLSSREPLMPTLLGHVRGPPYAVTLSISKSWLAKAGTVTRAFDGKKLARSALASPSSSRPSSMFAAWAGAEADTAAKEDTVKASPTVEAVPRPVAGRTSRLSTLFSSWYGDTSDSSISPPQARSRIVSEPLVLGDATNTSRSLVGQIDGLGITSISDDLDADFNVLIAELGIKGPQRSAMLELSDDRKRFLLAQHKSSKVASPAQPLRLHKTGPAQSTHGSTIGHLKRMSLATIGWSSPDDSELDLDAPVAGPSTPPAVSSAFSPSAPSAGGWASWFMFSPAQTGADAETDSPAFYATQLRSLKLSAKTLAKHLIALRVRLATAKMSWIADFAEHSDGLGALEAVLARFAVKTGTACV